MDAMCGQRSCIAGIVNWTSWIELDPDEGVTSQVALVTRPVDQRRRVLAALPSCLVSQPAKSGKLGTSEQRLSSRLAFVPIVCVGDCSHSLCNGQELWGHGYT